MNDTLRLTKPMMHGPAVLKLQEMGDLLGVDTGKNDGIFGKKTEEMIEELQKRFDLKVDGICGPATWKAMRLAADGGRRKIKAFDMLSSPVIYDRRGRHPKPNLYKERRPVDSIDSIVLHQTGCKMPLYADGWDRLNAHIGLTKLGDVIVENDFEDWIWHAQGLSARSIGIEIAGNFAGIHGDTRTLWKGGGGPHTLTMEQISGANKMLNFVFDETQNRGIKIRQIFAHRQSKDTRRADPGSEIWQKIGTLFMDKFGAIDGGDEFHRGSGKPIPKEWDPRRSSKYWA